MRVGQLWQWIYHWGVRDFAAMTNLAKDYRAHAGRALRHRACPRSCTRQVSADGTRKYLVRIAGGHEVETVYIPEEDRGTLCISSQVGCTLTCSFCHTGTQKLVRNLTRGRDRRPGHAGPRRPGRMAEARRAPKDETRLLSNVVLMGMGEPLYNFDNVRDAMKIVMDGEGIALSRRRITLSTSGVVPEIARAAEEIGCLLAVAFHATTDEVRDKLVPINKRWNIETLLDALREYPRLSNSERITFEYVMLDGRERQRRRRAAAGQADRGHPGQDQPDPVQRMARRALQAVVGQPHPAPSPTSSTRPATPARSARRGARTSWPPAAS